MSEGSGGRFVLGYRPGLDGLRGLAILLVVLSHALPIRMGGGFVGVDLFFVLSGFLITSILVEEWRETSTIRLGAFYARRALRLLPALLVVLAFCVVVSAARESAEQASAMRTSALMALFYSSNWFVAYRSFPHPILAHTWSLSVEEQFYLVWPLLLALLLRAGVSRRTLVGLLIALIVASAGLRALQWSSSHAWERVYYGSHTHADGLLLGALSALLLSWNGVPSSPRWKAGINTAAALGIAALLAVTIQGWPGDAYLYLGGYVLINLSALALVLALVSTPGAPLRRLFESAPMVWLGRISYGAYLWHIPVFWILYLTGVGGGSWGPATAVAGSFAAAALSFVALERPLLRIKRRFAHVKNA